MVIYSYSTVPISVDTVFLNDVAILLKYLVILELFFPLTACH